MEDYKNSDAFNFLNDELTDKEENTPSPTPEKEDGFFSGLGDTFSRNLDSMGQVVGGTASAIAQAPVNLLGATAKGIDYITGKEKDDKPHMITKTLSDWRNGMETFEKETLGINRDDWVGQTTDIMGNTFVTALSPSGVNAVVPKVGSAVGNIFKGLGIGVEETIKYDMLSKGETSTEDLLWGGGFGVAGTLVGQGIQKARNSNTIGMIDSLKLSLLDVSDDVVEAMKDNPKDLYAFLSGAEDSSSLLKKLKEGNKGLDINKDNIEDLGKAIKENSDKLYDELDTGLRDKVVEYQHILKETGSAIDMVDHTKVLARGEEQINSLFKPVLKNLRKQYNVKTTRTKDGNIKTISNLSDDELSAFIKSENKIKDMIDFVKNNGSMTTGDLIKMKQNVVDLVDFKKTDAFGDKGNRLAFEIGDAITDLTKQVSPDYKIYAEQYSSVKKQYEELISPLLNKGEYKENMIDDLLKVGQSKNVEKLAKYSKLFGINEKDLLKMVNSINDFSNIVGKRDQAYKGNLPLEKIKKITKDGDSIIEMKEIEKMITTEKDSKILKTLSEAGEGSDETLLHTALNMIKTPGIKQDKLKKVIGEDNVNKLKSLYIAGKISGASGKTAASALFNARAFTNNIPGDNSSLGVKALSATIAFFFKEPQIVIENIVKKNAARKNPIDEGKIKTLSKLLKEGDLGKIERFFVSAEKGFYQILKSMAQGSGRFMDELDDRFNLSNNSTKKKVKRTEEASLTDEDIEAFNIGEAVQGERISEKMINREMDYGNPFDSMVMNKPSKQTNTPLQKKTNNNDGEHLVFNND